MALFIFVLCCGTGLAEAKRMDPKKVEPVIFEGVKYTAPHEKRGYVEAWDIESGNIIWERKVYEMEYVPYKEEDVQRVYITKLSIKNGKLAVENEKGKKYEVNLVGKVERFSFNGFDFNLGSNKSEIIKNLGPTKNIKVTKIKNLHQP